MKSIETLIVGARMHGSKRDTGLTVFDFSDDLWPECERLIADHMSKATGHKVQAFGDDTGRRGVQAGAFPATDPDVMKSEVVRRLTVEVEKMIAVLKPLKPRANVSYSVGVSFAVGCGEWNEHAGIQFEWKKNVETKG